MIKKIYWVIAAILVLTGFGTTAIAQVSLPLVQTFDNTALPAGWATSGPESWLFTKTGLGYGATGVQDHTGNNGSFAWVDGSGSGTSPGITLESPFISQSAVSNLNLNFWLFSNNIDNPGDNNSFRVDYYNGSSWIDSVFTYSGDNPNWQEFNVNLSSYPVNGDVKVRFVVDEVATTAFYNDIILDDVVLKNIVPNDVGVTAITSPLAGGCGMSAQETITIRLKNFGTQTQFGFPVFYQLGSNLPVQEYFSGTLMPDSSALYTFNSTVDLSTPGNYSLTAYTSLFSDTETGNDSLSKVVTSIPTVSSFPYMEDFESGNGGWTSGGTNSTWALGTPAATVITGAASGSSAWATNLTGNYNNNERSWVKSNCFDFTSLVDPVIELKIWWSTETNWDGAVLQSSIDGGATWQRVGSVNDPVNWYTQASFSTTPGPGGQSQGWAGNGATGSGGYVAAKHDLNGLGGVSGVILRVAFASDGSGLYNGIAFDDIQIYDKPTTDVGVSRILTPGNGCGLSSSETVTVRIRNFGISPQGNMSVGYILNNGPAVTGFFSGTIPAGDSADYTFNQTADLSASGTYTIKGYTALVGDALITNDTSTRTITSIPTVSTFPYMEDFESGNGGWTSGGTNSTWALGTPAATVITGAASGSSAWATNLTGNYNNNERSWVKSNCFDFTSLVDPVIELKIWWSTETNWDGAVLQSSIDGGATWQRVGSVNDPVNWYTQASFSTTPGPGGQSQGWAGNGATGSGGYVAAKHDLNGLGGVSGVILRVAFASDGSGLYNGIAFDDIQIYDKPTTDVGVSRILTPGNGCGLSSSETVTVRIRNFGISPQGNMSVGYILNNGPAVTGFFSGTIPAGDSADYTFNQTADLSASGTYTIKGYTALVGDALITNDTSTRTITSIPTVSTFPYMEDFESGNGGWTPSGTASTWAYGTPAKSVINGAASGTNAWTTGGLTGSYPNNELSYLTSPCFDMTGASQVYFAAQVWWQTENNYDGAHLQLSTDGGNSWSIVGSANDPNWYNDPVGTFGLTNDAWAGRLSTNNGSGAYVFVTNSLPGAAGQANVRLRLVFRSDGSAIDDGFAIDDITVSSSPISSIAEEKLLANSINLYPNPTNGQLNISLSRPELMGKNVTLKVVDMQGRELKHRDISGKQDTSLDISELASGVYFVRIISGETVATKKVVKQ